MTRGAIMASAACALIGTPFRLHGRDPRFGLDCVGLIEQAARAGGIALDLGTAYGLRNSDIEPLRRAALAAGARILATSAPPALGDILLSQPGPAQHHLLIAVTGGSVHAHAGLARVAFMPGPCPYPTQSHWRFAAGIEEEPSWLR